MADFSIIDVTPDNLEEVGVYRANDRTSPGFRMKARWYREQYPDGLRMKIAFAPYGKRLGFIEFVPAESGWRPVAAPGYSLIHCIAVFGKAARGKGVGAALIAACVAESRAAGRSGVVATASDGPWMANGIICRNAGFVPGAVSGRFRLWSLAFVPGGGEPRFLETETELKTLTGWHLIYSDQCPWHDRAAREIAGSAGLHGIVLNIVRQSDSAEARRSPAAFGTFALVRDGRLLADHYISRTRFENILREESVVPRRG
jgi:GNAT superfamily N-acetyltransferase